MAYLGNGLTITGDSLLVSVADVKGASPGYPAGALMISGAMCYVPQRVTVDPHSAVTHISGAFSNFIELDLGRASQPGAGFGLHAHTLFLQYDEQDYPGKVIHFRCVVPPSGNSGQILVTLSGNFINGRSAAVLGTDNGGAGDSNAACWSIVSTTQGYTLLELDGTNTTLITL